MTHIILIFSSFYFSEKLKSLNISAIVLPPRVVVGRKGRVTISVEGRLADRVQANWFLNDVPIKDTSYTGTTHSPSKNKYLSVHSLTRSLSHFILGEKKYGRFRSATYTPRNSHVSVSEKGPLLSSTASGYYKLHTQLPLRSSSSTNKQLFSSLTFIPNLSIHKGAVFKCRISYKGKDKTVAERVSDKFTVLGQMAY